MTFWSENSWRKTQISLVRHVSLISLPTAWWADPMLSLLNLLPFGCCCLLCVVNKYCCAIWICCSETFHMLLQKVLKKSPVWVHPCFFKHLMLSICSYIESSCMDFLQCGFFHVCSNGLMLNIFCCWEQLNGLSPVWVLSCLFKWLDIKHL